MPRVGQLLRCTWVGTLPNGEIFNTSLWITFGDTISTLEQMQAIGDAIAAAWITHAAPDWVSLLPGTARYDELRTYRYTAPGPAPADLVVSTPLAMQGTRAGDLLPTQTSLVLTLKTALAGRSSRGRMYLPMLAQPLVAHQVPDLIIEALADSMAAFLRAIDDMELPILNAVVSSPTTSSAPRITQVQVDSLPDVQRRRANRATELNQADAIV